MRLVFCSDLHYAAEPGDEQALERAGATIDRLKPDMVVIAGDLTARGLVEQFAPVAEMARRLKAPHVFAIPGNRDYLAGGPPPSGPSDSDLQYFLAAPDTDDELQAGTLTTEFDEFFDGVDFFHRGSRVAIAGLDSEPAITDEAFKRGVAWLEGSAPALLRVFVTHRSLLPAPGKKMKDGDMLPNAGDLLHRLQQARVDLIVCAHLHRVHAWTLASGKRRTHVIHLPSLLDQTPGKDNGMVVVDQSGKRDVVAWLADLDGNNERTLIAAR